MVAATGRDQIATARWSSSGDSGARPNSLAKNSDATSLRIWASWSGSSFALAGSPAATLTAA